MTRAKGGGFKWWFVPLGCGGMLLLLAMFGLAIFLGVMGLIRKSDPYAEGLRLANADAQVLEALGGPVEPGWYVMGSIQTNPAGGSADLAIPVVGAHASGTLYVVATKQAGEWSYSRVELEPEGGGARVVVDGM